MRRNLLLAPIATIAAIALCAPSAIACTLKNETKQFQYSAYAVGGGGGYGWPAVSAKGGINKYSNVDLEFNGLSNSSRLLEIMRGSMGLDAKFDSPYRSISIRVSPKSGKVYKFDNSQYPPGSTYITFLRIGTGKSAEYVTQGKAIDEAKIVGGRAFLSLKEKSTALFLTAVRDGLPLLLGHGVVTGQSGGFRNLGDWELGPALKHAVPTAGDLMVEWLKKCEPKYR